MHGVVFNVEMVEMKCTNLKADDVRVLQLLEQRNLPDGGGGDALLLRLEPDLLHGDDLARLLVAPLEVRLTARVITHSSQLE